MTAATLDKPAHQDLVDLMHGLGTNARHAATVLRSTPGAMKDHALRAAATSLRQRSPDLLKANAKDVARAEETGLSKALIDRLRLDDGRIEAMAAGLEAIADLPDPVGRSLAAWERPNGLKIERVAVPLGVIGVIYESRPNVTADAAGLCLKAGSATVLRGGSDSFESAGVIVEAMTEAFVASGLPQATVQRVPTTDRDAVGHLLRMAGTVDVIVPRGGRSLVERVEAESRIPVFAHLDGICHVYLHERAAPAMAVAIAVNAKLRRTGICGAAETLLVDRAAAADLLPPVLAALRDGGCELRGDDATRAIDQAVLPADAADWTTEYLDAILSVRVVDGIDAAIEHINRYGSQHTDSIVTDDAEAAARFFEGVDSAIVMHNASTQFADGGEFGMGAEIGISTGRLHARGPIGAEQLTTFAYRVKGCGQTRPR